VPFHVEIRASLRRAWAFNLTEERLRGGILEPWRRGRPVELGDREWDPKESTLRILEGPELAPPELAHGQGWNQAERSARDVTGEILARAVKEATSVAVLAETAAAGRAISDPLAELGARVVDWAAVRARILAPATAVGAHPLDDGGIVSVVLVVERSDPESSWMFDAGLAIGAVGGRAIIVQLGDEPPPAALGDLGVVRVDPADPVSLQALVERLRHATAA
jgi:hypothetical protein